MKPKYIELTGSQYLSEVINKIPAGRLYKKYTGIGATTVEINSNRHSIIVFPTRALAATKAIKHGLLYFGGSYPGITKSDSKEIVELLEAGNQFVKIAAVADSFVSLYNEAGAILKDHFFLMLDEIDSFQSEAHYRPNLEECLDIYFDFPDDKRAMVSATIQDSLDEEIEKEQLWVVNKKCDQLPTIVAISSQTFPIEKIVETIILGYNRLKDDEKVLVAFNSIDGILEIINLLTTKNIAIKDMAALVSESSIDDIPIDLRGRLSEKGKLPAKINFITSAYFVGIDIDESAYVIEITDKNLSHTILTKAKIVQIIGRIRGKMLRCILFLNFAENELLDLNNYKSKLLAQQRHAVEVAECMRKTNALQSFPELFKKQLDWYVENAKVEDVNLLRFVNDQVKVNRLALDYLYNNAKALNDIYNSEESFLKTFEKDYVLKVINTFDNVSQNEILQNQKNEESSKKRKNQKRLEIIDNYGKITYSLTPKPIYAKKDIVEEILLLLSKSEIDFDSAKEKLRRLVESSVTNKPLNNIYRQLSIFILEEKHPLKQLLNEQFLINKPYTPEDILDRLILIEKQVNDRTLIKVEDIKNSKNATSYFRLVFKSKRAEHNTAWKSLGWKSIQDILKK